LNEKDFDEGVPYLFVTSSEDGDLCTHSYTPVVGDRIGTKVVKTLIRLQDEVDEDGYPTKAVKMYGLLCDVLSLASDMTEKQLSESLLKLGKLVGEKGLKKSDLKNWNWHVIPKELVEKRRPVYFVNVQSWC